MSDGWIGGSLVIESSGAVFPIMMPVIPEAEQARLAGYSITLCCPVGCQHHVAAETTWDETLQIAAMRMEAAPGWTNGLLVAGYYPLELVDFFREAKAGCDAHFRGRAH